MTQITPVRQATHAPAIHIVVERAPFKRGDVVWQRITPTLWRKARVAVCYWADDMGAGGEWSVRLAYHPFVLDEYDRLTYDASGVVQNLETVLYTWTSPRVCEKVE